MTNRRIQEFQRLSEESASAALNSWHKIEESIIGNTRECQPKVIAIVPNYNNREYINDAIDGLLAQREVELTIQVIDNCSNDGSWEILEDYEKRHPNLQIYRMSRNSGPHVTGSCLLKGVMAPYVIFASGNDRLMDNYFIAKAVTYIEKHPNTVLVYGKHQRENGAMEPDSFCYSACCTNKSNDLTQKELTDIKIWDMCERFLQVVALYTSGEPLWGVYRSEALKRIPMIHGYGSDHALVSCIALFGDVIGIRRLVRKASTSHNESNSELREVQEQSRYSIDGSTPAETYFGKFNFVSLAYTYYKAIQLLDIRKSAKVYLYDKTFDILVERFKKFYIEEVANCECLLKKLNQMNQGTKRLNGIALIDKLESLIVLRDIKKRLL